MLRQLTRATLVRLVVGVALLTMLAFTAAGTARAGTPYVYTDKAGDSLSAPDVQKVMLTDNGNGTVGVEIDLAAVIPDDGDSCVVVMVDSDRNAQTGTDGYDYAFYGDAQGAGFMKWDGADWADFVHQPVSPDLVGGRLTFTLTLSDIGATSFDFFIGAMHGDDIDAVPESGLFTYPQAPAKPTLRSVMVNMGVLVPKAGKKFTVPAPSVRLSDDEVVAPDTYTCTLTNHGKKVQPVKNCTWQLPKATKGKTLTLKLAVTYQGQKGSITLPVMPK